MDIRLRALEPEDIDFLYTAENNPDIRECSSASVPYSRDLLRQFILSTTGDIYTDKQVRLVIETTDGLQVGLVDLSSFNPQHLRAEVGIMVHPHWQSQGIGTRALSLLEHYAQTVIHLHQVYAIVAEENNVSLKLFRKAGYNITSTLPDWLFNGEKYQNAILLQKKI